MKCGFCGINTTDTVDLEYADGSVEHFAACDDRAACNDRARAADKAARAQFEGFMNIMSDTIGRFKV